MYAIGNEDKTVRSCPFCGEIHPTVQMGEVVGYDEITGEAIGGKYQLAVRVDCLKFNRIDTYIPLYLWNERK